MPVEETFFRMLRHKEFDLAEMSLSSYSVSMSQPGATVRGDTRFSLRASFRHSCIYVNANAGIREATRPDRQTRGQPGIPDDGAGVDTRHPVRPLRRAGGQRDLLHGWRGGAGPLRKDQARPAAQYPGPKHRPGTDAWRRCFSMARSMPCTRRACRRAFSRVAARSNACSRTTSRWSATTFSETEVVPHHAHRGHAARRLRSPSLDRAVR